MDSLKCTKCGEESTTYWVFKKFFVRQMRLGIYEVVQLRNELNKVIEYHNERTKIREIKE